MQEPDANEPGSRPPQPNGLALWRVDLRRSSEWVEEAVRSVLQPEEAVRRDREPDAVWRRRMVGRTALRVALGRRLGREPRALRFARGPNEKPRLRCADGEPAPRFNLSHSDDLCVIAISEGAAVGVDVEVIRDRSRLERLVETRLAPEEADEILRLEGVERRHAFYRCWTRKEAYLKALGRGLAADLSAFAVSTTPRPVLRRGLEGDGRNWAMVDLELGDEVAGALALAGPSTDGPTQLRPAELSGVLDR